MGQTKISFRLPRYKIGGAKKCDEAVPLNADTSKPLKYDSCSAAIISSSQIQGLKLVLTLFNHLHRVRIKCKFFL